jgi:hypothetical protein
LAVDVVGMDAGNIGHINQEVIGLLDKGEDINDAPVSQVRVDAGAG